MKVPTSTSNTEGDLGIDRDTYSSGWEDAHRAFKLKINVNESVQKYLHELSNYNEITYFECCDTQENRCGEQSDFPKL